MIDYDDFKGMCDRVARVTGRIDEETRKVYYEALKDHDRNVVFLAMRRVGKDHGFYKFPTIAEIMDAIRDVSSGPRTVPTWCEKCNLTGFIIAERDGHSTAFRCDCPNGARLSKRIRPFSEVSGLYGADLPAEPGPLPIVPVDGIEALPPGYAFEEGVAVEKLCGACWEPYRFAHRRRITKEGLMEFHLSRPAMCDKCYIEEGRKHGHWK